MDATETPTPEEERPRWRLGLQRLRLRFTDPLETEFNADRFRHNIGNIRFAFVAGIALWVVWGFLLRRYLTVLDDQRVDAVMRFGFFIPMLVGGFALSYTRIFERIRKWSRGRHRDG